MRNDLWSLSHVLKVQKTWCSHIFIATLYDPFLTCTTILEVNLISTASLPVNLRSWKWQPPDCSNYRKRFLETILIMYSTTHSHFPNMQFSMYRIPTFTQLNIFFRSWPTWIHGVMATKSMYGAEIPNSLSMMKEQNINVKKNILFQHSKGPIFLLSTTHRLMHMYMYISHKRRLIITPSNNNSICTALLLLSNASRDFYTVMEHIHVSMSHHHKECKLHRLSATLLTSLTKMPDTYYTWHQKKSIYLRAIYSLQNVGFVLLSIGSSVISTREC